MCKKGESRCMKHRIQRKREQAKIPMNALQNKFFMGVPYTVFSDFFSESKQLRGFLHAVCDFYLEGTAGLAALAADAS